MHTLPPREVVVIVECRHCSRGNRVPAARLLDKAHCAACKSALLPVDQPIAITSPEDFAELVRDAKAPVLVDFWAQWCGPCHMVAPGIKQIANENAGRVIVAKVETDALPTVAAQFAIRSIPTMIAFRGGRESKRVSGAMPPAQIVSQLGL